MESRLKTKQYLTDLHFVFKVTHQYIINTEYLRAGKLFNNIAKSNLLTKLSPAEVTDYNGADNPDQPDIYNDGETQNYAITEPKNASPVMPVRHWPCQTTDLQWQGGKRGKRCGREVGIEPLVYSNKEGQDSNNATRVSSQNDTSDFQTLSLFKSDPISQS